jgi:hypothetical protein
MLLAFETLRRDYARLSAEKQKVQAMIVKLMEQNHELSVQLTQAGRV